MKFRVPLTVNVAPVQTYTKTIEVEAATRQEARMLILGRWRPGNDILSNAIGSPGWKPVGGRLGHITPNATAYDTYLDERGLEEWASTPPETAPPPAANPVPGRERK